MSILVKKLKDDIDKMIKKTNKKYQRHNCVFALCKGISHHSLAQLQKGPKGFEWNTPCCFSYHLTITKTKREQGLMNKTVGQEQSDKDNLIFFFMLQSKHSSFYLSLCCACTIPHHDIVRTCTIIHLTALNNEQNRSAFWIIVRCLSYVTKTDCLSKVPTPMCKNDEASGSSKGFSDGFNNNHNRLAA